ncbi:MAG: ArsA-related P-loop ATPase [Acidimicrobiales bacterium]
MSDSMLDIATTSSVVLCCGSGGVGKTTTAAVIALEAARHGRRAVVVTIDPAKRLADALGLDGLTNSPTTIDGPWPGTLAALMLDTESTFNGLVAKYAGSPEQAEKILSNAFYRNISGALSGTQEYMATEKLYELSSEGDFDLIVVDTPPTRNALDFLDAPNRIARFLDHPLYRMVTAPTRGIVKAVNMAAQPFLRGVAKVVGGEVIADAIAFFAAFDGMEEGFKMRARMVEQLLGDDLTSFVLVASPRRDTVEEAAFFAARLAEMALSVKSVVVNRIYPEFGSADAADAAPEGSDLADLAQNLRELNDIARAERSHLAPLADRVRPAPLVEVPLLPFEVHDLDTLSKLADHLFGRV